MTDSSSKNTWSHLFYVWDCRNKLKFLVDTNAAISMIQYNNDPSAKPTLFKLLAANGFTIDTYGGKRLTMNIGMRQDFTWTFTIADMKIPILGADFLAHYELAAHMNPRTLSDKTMNIHVLGTPTFHSTTEISVTMCHGCKYLDLLNQLVDIMQPFKAADSGGHQTQYHIRTSRAPAYSRSWPLAPHKLAYAKAQFDKILNNGFIHPSNSPYTSPLPLVPKPGDEEYQKFVNRPRLLPCSSNPQLCIQTRWCSHLFQNRPDEGISSDPCGSGRHP